MSFVERELSGFVATLTLDHDARRNVLSRAMVEAMIAALQSFREARARVVVIRAHPGAAVFSAGHDVNELPESRRDPLGWDDPLRQLVREIETFPGAVIASVEGTVWGGGTEMVLACDLVVAAAGVTFALTPAKLGVPYNAGGLLTFLNAAGLRIAKEMAFTAEPLAVERAERLGMVNRVVPAAELALATESLAIRIAEQAPLSIAVMKEQLRILAGAHPMSPQGFERVQGMRRTVYDSADYREGIRAFKEKRKPVFRGD